MAAIIIGVIEINNVVRGDMLDVSFGVQHDLDLTGKSLYSEVRREQDTEVILKFSELDNSLIKTVTSSQLMNLRFHKDASNMAVPVGAYQLSVVMGTAPNYEDKQTIIQGTLKVGREITHKPTV